MNNLTLESVFSAKQHYQNHLAEFYTWSLGDMQARQTSFQEFLASQNLIPKGNGVCFDLGAGSGLHTIPLARAGYAVKAIDFSDKLLTELAEQAHDLDIECIEADIRNLHRFAGLNPELIVCAGDTLTHLESLQEVESLLGSCHQLLADEGRLLLSFRDYTQELTGTDRFIPVRSDDTRIHTCMLEYAMDKVRVTDLFHEQTGNGWVQKVSAYEKIRLQPEAVADDLKRVGMHIIFHQTIQGMVYLIGEKR